VRVWDIPPGKLCRDHLLGEHRELHAIWVILTKKRKGYSRHPETLRWKGKLRALYTRHGKLVKEMRKRGYKHRSNLSSKLATGSKRQCAYIDTPKVQINILKRKRCGCKV
jgi:hypothetical protein